MNTYNLSINVNGVDIVDEVESHKTLADYLRDDLNLKGTHIGCDTVSCGACTVLFDDKPIKSCSVLAITCENAKILTVESLDENGEHPLQQSFKNNFALQCGFCTPGFLMMGLYLLNEKRKYTREEITKILEGNICRCTGYITIIDAIHNSIEKER